MWWIFIPLIVIILIAIWAISSYKLLSGKSDKVKTQKELLDNKLIKYYDLTPNIINTIKDYANHEKASYEKVITARNHFLNAETQFDRLKADHEITNIIHSLYNIVENYPDLKANFGFLNLKKEISEAEEEIESTLKTYNESVSIYNNAVLDHSIFAKIFDFNLFEFIKDEEK